MTSTFDTWPAVSWLWLVEGAAFYALLQWSWSRKVPGVRPFRGLAFGGMLYVTAEALLLTLPEGAGRYWLGGISMLGVGITLPNLVTLFADITGKNEWLTKRTRTVLYASGLGLGLARFADPWWSLIYSNEEVVQQHGMFLSRYSQGLLHYFLMAGLMAAMLLGLVNIALTWRDASRLMRRHLAALALSCLVPVMAAVVFNAGWQPWGLLDLTPFALLCTTGLTTWAIFHDRLVEVVPIARNYLVDRFQDGVLVVDPAHVVVDTNPALRKMLNLTEGEPLGRPVGALLKAWPTLAELCSHHQPGQIELQAKMGDEVYWQASWHPLGSGRDAKTTGFLLVLADISAHKRAESQLHELVAERTAEWRRATNSMFRSADEEKRKVGQALREHFSHELSHVETDATALAACCAAQPELRDAAEQLSREIASTTRQIQDFATVLEGPDLARQTFKEALAALLTSLEAAYGVKCVLSLAPDFPAPLRERGRHFIAVVREAVVNAVRHAKAKHVRIDLVHAAGGDTITIRNDGEPLAAQETLSEGLGLRQMRLRTALLNGRLSLRRGETEGGVVELLVPPQTAETQPGFFQV